MAQIQSSNSAARHRTLMIIWGALFGSLFIYGFVAWMAVVNLGNQGLTPLLPAFGLLGLSVFAVSFFLKNKLIGGAIAARNPNGVQSGYIVAWAMADAIALFGLVGCFVEFNLAYLALFALAVVAFVLHLPRRADIEAATAGGA